MFKYLLSFLASQSLKDLFLLESSSILKNCRCIGSKSNAIELKCAAVRCIPDKSNIVRLFEFLKMSLRKYNFPMFSF